MFTNLLSTGGTSLGTLGAGFYFEGNGFAGNGRNDAIGIWYDTTSGSLYYNPTGGTAGDSTLFAIVAGATAALDSIDFTLFSPPLTPGRTTTRRRLRRHQQRRRPISAPSARWAPRAPW